MIRTLGRPLLFAALALTLAAATPLGAAGDSGNLQQINHIIVIYQENWSFDSLYGYFPGANGLAAAGTVKQVDLTGAPITTNPAAYSDTGPPPVVDSHIPVGLPMAPYDLNKYLPTTMLSGDIVHRYYQEQVQIDGGKNDKFVTASDNPGLVMSYYDASNLPEGKLAKQYVMMDNFFHSAFGGSFINHQWLICACTPKWDTTVAPAPESKRTELDANKLPASGKDGFLTTTAEGDYVVNTAYSVNHPHPKGNDTDPAKKAQLVPNLTAPTIGDRMNDKGVSWKWYSGGFTSALAGAPDSLFQFHHQPFIYYKNYADGTQAKKDHLDDESVFFADIARNTLPQVSFVKPLGPDNEHPGYANELQGQNHVASIVRAVKNSPAWKDTAIVITYDENGGRWDHVAPPKEDRWGPGVRVPAIIVSPLAKTGFVDHTQYETVSILAMIEHRFGLQPLSDRDKNAGDLSTAFNPASASSSISLTSPLVLIALAVVVLVLIFGGVAFLRRE